MTDKFTPGPHRVEDREERLLIWADGGHEYLAELSTVADGADEEAGERWAEEQRANADLYAAATDLLDAARLALPHHQGGKSAVGRALRDAIAKAEGRS